MNEQVYDVGIIGGGLAGMTAAILLARAGFSVAVCEKEKYPFHKVCGEYLSMEGRPFLESIGLPLGEMDLPRIHRLFLSAPNGKYLVAPLPLGGLGISRYRLDAALAGLVKEAGVTIFEETKATEVRREGNHFFIDAASAPNSTILKVKVCCGAWGKRSNLDLKWRRGFVNDQKERLDNYVAVKYHIDTDWPRDLIGLHNFNGGYCGISAIEEGKVSLCYMTRAEILRKSNNSLEELQGNILNRNPHLQKIFSQAGSINGFPVTISQISFQKKTTVENGILMLGDAAGMITPLCGNGMSIALHTGKIAAGLVCSFLKNEITREGLELAYKNSWDHHFGNRLKTGRIIQKFFGNERLSNVLVSAFKTFPFLTTPVIRQTHGSYF